MSILNSLPKQVAVATENTNGLMSAADKIAVNKINRIEKDVADKMSRTDKIKSSQLDTSNNAVKIQPNNLSDEVKNMMTGRTPVSPNIGLKTLITDYYADKSVTFDKRTAAGSIAIISSNEFCNFDTKTNDSEVILSIPGNYTVYYGNKRKDITNTPESVNMDKGSVSIITYSELEGFSAYSEDAVKEQDFVVGAFDGTTVSMFNGRYTVDGSVVVGDQSLDGMAIKDFSIDSRKLAIQHGVIISKESGAPYINANFTSKFIEVVKPFIISIADQYAMTIKIGQECKIPDNTNNKDYLYLYYDLGTGKLNAMWSSNDITKTILTSNQKLVLIGIIYNKERSIGLNSNFISVNATFTRDKYTKYLDIFSGKIVVNFNTKKISATNVKGFIDDTLVQLSDGTSQTIILSDNIISDIVNSEIPYTLAVVKSDFDSNDHRLVFGKTENITSLGLDIFPLFTIKKYTISNNKDIVTVIKTDGNIVKSNNIITTGYTLPIDDETIVAKLSTEMSEGNLILTAATVPGTSVVDPMSNIRYNITKENRYQLTIKNLHGLYAVLYNTETDKIELIDESVYDIDSSKYISLGFVTELSDSLAYRAVGHITNHITLNANRPANYSITDGPDPDKGYDWSNNRLVLPKDIYLLTNSQYSIYCQNMSMNRYIDNDYINYEIATPTLSLITENVFNISSSVSGVFDTRVVGKFKGNNNCLFKDVTLHFDTPKGKDITVLCIGDDTVDMNMPGYIKTYLKALGYNPTMLGKTKNSIKVNGYGLKNVPEEYGEGHRGWRLTDFMCKTKHKDSSPYYIQGNPFMKDSKFNFTHYMTTNSYSKVDAVVISVGQNDITGYHTAASIENIENLTISQNIEQLPSLYKQMITSIHEFDPNIKIIINPTMIKGIDDDYNRKSLMLTEVLEYDLKDMPNTFFVPGYLGQPLFAGANSSSTSGYIPSSDINDTKLGSPVNSFDINGMAQSNLAYMITSTIAVVTKE